MELKDNNEEIMDDVSVDTQDNTDEAVSEDNEQKEGEVEENE